MARVPRQGKYPRPSNPCLWLLTGGRTRLRWRGDEGRCRRFRRICNKQKCLPSSSQVDERHPQEHFLFYFSLFYLIFLAAGTTEIINAAGRSEIPAFQIVTLSGKTFSQEDFKNKFVFIHFWGSWHRECRSEILHFKNLYKIFKQNQKKSWN